MKGLIDLRVANILAKQAAMQHNAMMFQNKIAQHEADNAAWYTARADNLEEAYKNGTYNPDDPNLRQPPPFISPESSVWYSPWKLSFLSKGKDDSFVLDRIPRPIYSASINASFILAGFIQVSRKARCTDFL